MTNRPVGAPLPSNYTIRRLRPEDAAGVSQCVRAVYGEHYIVHTEFYHPEQIVQLNETGHLISVVALDAAQEVVGHYALERPELGPVAESGAAMVLPEHRHHQLLERMRQPLEEEAHTLGLLGLFGRVVTSHVFSQMAVERFGELPCALLLGRSPSTFHSLTETLPQRMSNLIYFKYLRPAAEVVLAVPAWHREMCMRIYGQFGIVIDFLESAPVTGPGEHRVHFHPEMQRLTIQVLRVGTDTPREIGRIRHEYCTAGRAEVVYVELPLAQAGTPEVCQRVEAEGFFFSGVAPRFFADGDALRLQYLTVDLDTSRLQLENSFVRELAAYVERERHRVAIGN